MREYWYCKFCLRQTEIEHDGVNGHCLGCGTPVIKLRMSNDIFDTAWFPVAEFIAGKVYAPAGVALETLKRVDESAPRDWQPLLNFAALLIFGIVGGLVLREALHGR